MALTVVDGGMLSATNAQYTMFKNRLINGAMVLDQRRAGASVTPTVTNTYTLDRWVALLSQSSKFSVQQNAGSVTPPTGFSNYLGMTSLSAYTVGASEFFSMYQFIEGLNTADFAWGTASAATVTLSFWVRSSLTGTFGGTIQNYSGDANYPFSYTISSANTWEQKSVVITGPSIGSWPTNNTAGVSVGFCLGAGATVSGTAGSWSSTVYRSATGATSVVGTNAATFYITGVQLEKGSTATAFDYRPYTTELQLCQRYYNNATYPTVGSTLGMTCNVTTGVNYHFSFAFPVAMRAAPTLTWTEWTSQSFPSTSAIFQVQGIYGSNVYKTANATAAGGYFLGGYTATAEL